MLANTSKETLQRLVDKGGTWDEIARPLGYTGEHFRRIARRKGVFKKHARLCGDWTAADLWYLGELCEVRPHLYRQRISELTGYSHNCIRNALLKYGLQHPISFRRKTPPTPRNIEIITLRHQGQAPSVIARTLGLNIGVVTGVLGRAGMVHKAPIKRRPPPKPPAPPRPSRLPAVPRSAWAQVFTSPPRSIDDLLPYQCRWPLWDANTDPRHYCGVAVEKTGWDKHSVRYCSHHFAVGTR